MPSTQTIYDPCGWQERSSSVLSPLNSQCSTSTPLTLNTRIICHSPPLTLTLVIPVVGLGGISNATDAVEFMLAGASAIEIGTANFIDPAVSAKVAWGINEYCERHGFQKVTELIGALEC